METRQLLIIVLFLFLSVLAILGFAVLGEGLGQDWPAGSTETATIEP